MDILTSYHPLILSYNCIQDASPGCEGIHTDPLWRFVPSLVVSPFDTSFLEMWYFHGRLRILPACVIAQALPSNDPSLIAISVLCSPHPFCTTLGQLDESCFERSSLCRAGLVTERIQLHESKPHPEDGIKMWTSTAARAPKGTWIPSQPDDVLECNMMRTIHRWR